MTTDGMCNVFCKQYTFGSDSNRQYVSDNVYQCFSIFLLMLTDVFATMIGNVFANVLVLITIWVLVNLSVIFKNPYMLLIIHRPFQK